MLRGKMKVALAGGGFAVLAMAVLSCASILGIEELKPAGTDGGVTSAGGSGGSSGGASGSSAGGSSSGASGSSAGGSSGGSSGGAGGTAGSTSGSGGGGGASGSGGGATGGAAGNLVDGGAGRGGSGGTVLLDAGDSGGSAITVRGTVIDYWRHRVPNVNVYLGTASATTDANGQFTINNVTPPYDIGLAVRVGFVQFGGSEDTYMFKGLHRPDPTLQVKDGLVGSSSGGNTWKFQNYPPGSGNAYRHMGIAFGSPDTIWDYTWDGPDGTDLGATNIDYEGAPTSVGTAYALLWETPDQNAVLPSRFVAYDQKPLTLDDMTKNVTFDVAADNTPAETIAGSVTAAMPGAIQIDGYVRFDSGAPIHVVQLSNAGQNFQMLMPRIAGSSITVSALVGTTPSGPYSLAHLDGLTPGQGTVPLTVPAPVSLVSPAPGAMNIAAGAMFQWSASPSVAFLYIDCPDPQTNGTIRFFVVTEDYRAQLPVLGAAGGIPLPKGRRCTWSVELHGSYPTIDQAAGPTGFLDSHSYYYYGELWGLKRDNGSFTMSSSYYLTTAP